MKFKALLNKRNYIHFYHRVIPFPKHLNKAPADYSDFVDFDSIIDNLEVRKFKTIIVVASGPSAINLKRDDTSLYFCCNDAIKLVKDLNFVYLLQDPFYLMRYLKKFRGKENWKGTVFWFYNTHGNQEMFKTIKSYLQRFSRNKREFLITNKENEHIFYEIRGILEKNFGYKHFGVNSGFNTVVFAAVIAHKTNLPLEIYGLDAGVGGEKYFNKSSSLGLNIKKDNTRKKISEFLESLRRSRMDFMNYSNFKGVKFED